MTDEELDDLAERSAVMASIAADLKRAHTAIRALMILFVALLVIAAGGLVLSARVSRNAHDIATVQDVFVANCESGNEFRAGLDELFAPLLTDAPPATPRTPAQQDQFDAFKATADRIFKLRDCSELPATPAQP